MKFNPLLFFSAALAITIPLASAAGSEKPASDTARYQAVLALKPVGYWPADEGSGETLNDRSGNNNHGRIIHVPWDKGLLDFTGAYQWAEIPASTKYQSKSLTIGGWVFIRSKVEGSGWPNRQGMLLIGNKDWLNAVGVQLCVRKQELVDVVSRGKEDVFGTRLWSPEKRLGEGKPSLTLGEWHHLLYTFEATPWKDAADTINLALAAVVSASDDGGDASRAPKNAIDGKPDTSWVPGAGKSPDNKKWIQLDFGKETKINRIKLAGDSKGEFFKAGKLRFSDGSIIDVPDLDKEWDAFFTGKMVRWVRYEPSVSQGARPGLKEFEAYTSDISVYQEEGVITNMKFGDAIRGKGSLYLDGRLLATKEDVPYKSVNRSIQIGNDAYWWHQMNVMSGSLDGSVRDMVWFDRALSAEEAARLHEATRPSAQPKFYGEDMVVLNGRGIAAGDLKDLTAPQRRAALQLFGKKDAATLQPLSNTLLPVLTAALEEADCRLPAAQLLLKLNSDPARAALRNALPQMIAVVQAADRAQSERAEAALALAAMKQDASSATAALAQTLKELLKQEGERLPRVEDLLRNALIRALLDISPNDPQVRDILGLALAKPVFALMDLTGPRFDAVRHLLDEHRTMDALDAFRKLPPEENGERFFSYQEPGNRDYTSTIHVKGVTYKVGNGKAWQGGEQVSKDDSEKLIGKLAGKYPQAKDWHLSDYPHLYRIPITKIHPDGTQEKVYLGGEDFVIDGSDQKMLGWSLFVDEAGHIHLMGGQHNVPNPDNYIPGSWEQMGIPRDRNHADFPAQMYWVTKEPGNIETFEFVGRKSDPRAIPAGYLNYMVFLQNSANKTYLYGRAGACGWQCWGMFRYDAETRRWATVGGDPFDLIESARRHDANWLNYLHDPIRGSVPKAPTADRPLAWAWQPPFYNFCRDDWGAKFDKTGRLHIKMKIEGLDGGGYVRISSVYAYSDDNAKTFHRADGSPVALPLTINPAPEHNADMLKNNTDQWWNLWLSIVRHAGLK